MLVLLQLLKVPFFYPLSPVGERVRAGGNNLFSIPNNNLNMIRVTGLNGHGPIKLLQDHQPAQFMSQGQAG